MKNWDEIRAAYAVAKLGTVTAAAESLGMQRATVIRHIDQLESELGTKLFQRHGRGYTPTEMGNDLVEVYPTNPDWHSSNWLVTHGDLHRSEKVQRFLHLLAEISQ